MSRSKYQIADLDTEVILDKTEYKELLSEHDMVSRLWQLGYRFWSPNDATQPEFLRALRTVNFLRDGGPE